MPSEGRGTHTYKYSGTPRDCINYTDWLHPAAVTIATTAVDPGVQVAAAILDGCRGTLLTLHTPPQASTGCPFVWKTMARASEMRYRKKVGEQTQKAVYVL